MIKRNTTKVIFLAAMGVAMAASTAHAQLADGLVSYWPLDGNPADISDAPRYNAEEMGADPIVYEAGKFGEAPRLNGEDQYFLVTGDENVFDFAFVDGDESTGSMSLSAWFTVDALDTSWQALIAKGEGNGWRLHRRGEEQFMAFTGGNGDTDPNDAALVLNDGNNLNWHHVVALTDGGLVHRGEEGDTMAEHSTRLYLDGELVASKTNGRLENRGNPMMIGNNPDSATREWEGHVDDVAVWNRPLTPIEIGQIWAGGAGASIGDLLGVAPPIVGDFNGDMVIDSADFLVMAANFHKDGAALNEGDMNFDGRVDIHDFALFRTKFSQPAGAAAVPEPATLLLALGLPLLGLRLRRKRKSS